MIQSAFNFKKWIEDNRHLLKPPVGNKVIWKDREFIVMVVGGPNSRTDFHVNQSEEFFYQLEGDIQVKLQIIQIVTCYKKLWFTQTNIKISTHRFKEYQNKLSTFMEQITRLLLKISLFLMFSIDYILRLISN